jgi:hypothetical protein
MDLGGFGLGDRLAVQVWTVAAASLNGGFMQRTAARHGLHELPVTAGLALAAVAWPDIHINSTES